MEKQITFSALIYETEKGFIDAQKIGIELLTALANFQNECPTIEKRKKGYGYNYADFTTSIETMKPFLKKHGLGFSQMIEETNKLRTIVFHIETGQLIQSVLTMASGYELKGMNIYQTEGARNSYYKRYSLFSMLGVITAEEDIDAKGQTKPVENKKQQSKPDKVKLNNNQFIQLLGAINAGDITIKDAFNYYDFDENQKLTLNNL
jgi:hypothetical protein